METAEATDDRQAAAELELVCGKYASLVYMVNGRSILWTVKIRSHRELRDLHLRVEYSPAHVQAQGLSIAQLLPGQTLTLRVASPAYSEEALLGITDDEPGVVRVTLEHEDGREIAHAEDSFKWLAFNAWAGGIEFPELLAALVLPYDPAVDTITAEQRKLTGLPAEVPSPGYDAEPGEVVQEIHRLWETLLRYGIDYKLPPADGVRDIGVGQRVRTPSVIREKGYSTCLDSTLLMAACLTRLRLNPIVIIIAEHAFLCVYLQRGALPSPSGTPLATVRNLLNNHRLIAIETTGINSNMDFDTAVLCGVDTLNKLPEDAEFTALDIEQIWHELGIHPIMGDCPPANDSGSRSGDTADTLITARPRSRMESWQRKLLDLSLRNNLLNTRDTGRNQIHLSVPDVAELEDKLAAGITYRIKPLPETCWTDTTKAHSGDINDQQARRMQEAAAAMFCKNELLADIRPGALQGALHMLYTTSRREMEESGVNTLFIACGFVRWVPKGSAAEQALRAPLLLIPVRMSRTSVRDGFSLSGMEDEAHINHTLLELLKTEFALRIPELEGELPKDESGLDVPLIFAIARRAISSMVGWEVQEGCCLGSYSFSKYLMWKDLSDRRELLLRNPVVRHLAADARGIFPEQVGFPELDSLDNEVDAQQVFTPLPSDSSQLAAILAAARGKNFVLEGPPGTGKSQTIANMIAHCLGHGKTVLFVAEKAVALEVVHKRLARIGLSNYCLELHSNKTLLSSVMRQFREAVAALSDPPAADEWEENVSTMTALRSMLNSLPREMHRPYPDGSSLYEDICLIISHAELPAVELPPEDPAELPRARKRELVELADELAAHFALLTAEGRSAAPLLAADAYTPEWDARLAQALQSAADTLAAQDSLLTRLCAALGLPPEDATLHRAELTVALQVAHSHGDADWSALLPSRSAGTRRRLRTALQHAQQYRSLRATLSLPYPESAVEMPEPELWQREYAAALTKIWPLRWWGMRKIARALRTLAGSDRTPDCAHDLSTLTAMRQEKHAAEEACAALPPFLARGTSTDEALLSEADCLIERLAAPCAADESAALRLLEQRCRLAEDGRLESIVSDFHALAESLQHTAQQLTELLGTDMHGTTAAGDAATLHRLLGARSQWRSITLWNKCARSAAARGCGAAAELLLSGAVPAALLPQCVRVSIARAKLSAAVASIEQLRDFAPLIHEKRIRDFADREAELRSRTCSHICNLLARRAAGITRHERETAILQREISKKRQHMPLRKLLAATPHITPLLKPCFLMSPLSVAQYLGPEAPPFDVVIFDEASQIPVWDAIGAIGRGSSVIICGDPHQMPPTSFFSRSKSDEGADDEAEQDMESILDECLACGIPKMNLTWHYRSKSESLIAFSNAQYYEGKMTTFPSPSLRDTALQLHPIAGLYEAGATKRTNRPEAQAVVQHVLDTLRSPGFRYTEATSIGIVTFNAQQQKLISDLFEDALAADPSLEPFFSEDNPEAVFVKNLENVQGDERGVIYFSTTYGRDADGKLSMNFGPLNLTGGERRLNVAVTRARYAMHVFTSLRPEDIDLSRTRARGAADLRAFLEYARHAARLSVAGVSDLERDALAHRIVADLEPHGLRCRTHVGASDYRVDIVVEHPDRENAVLAGITLDGPAYAAAHTARDRDVVRPDTMRLLGWHMLHVWSIDWWLEPQACLAALLEKLHALRTAAPETQAELPSLIPTGEPHAPAAQPEEPPAPAPPKQSRMQPGPAFVSYVQAETLPALFEMSNRSLQLLISRIIATEAPLSQAHLFARLLTIAPVPFSRNSRAFKECIVRLRHSLSDILREMESLHSICLHSETSPADASAEPALIISLPGAPTVRPRTAGPRPLEIIPISELQEIARITQAELRCLPGSDDHLRGMADFLAIPRLTKKAKDFLLTVIRS